MPLLKVNGISKTLGDKTVIKEISFEQRASEKLAIAGETGSGKTTLLKTIAGLVQPDSGVVMFEDEAVDGPDFQLVPGHPSIGYLSQHYELRNNYFVEELLSYANKLPGIQAQRIYEVCRIDHLVRRRTDQLSGGEKQRIALARLLVGTPKLLLLDEPFSNLDPQHKKILKSVIADISEKLSVTCLLTSHDPMDTLSWAQRIMVLKDGKTEQTGTPENIYKNPRNTYVAGLFGEYQLLNEAEAGYLKTAFPSEQQGKKLFTRPSDFELSKNQSNANATVTRSSFWGTHYDIEILCNDRTLVVRSQHGGYKKGDQVFVSLPARDWWFLNG